jgi:hypothetical protein
MTPNCSKLVLFEVLNGEVEILYSIDLTHFVKLIEKIKKVIHGFYQKNLRCSLKGMFSVQYSAIEIC